MARILAIPTVLAATLALSACDPYPTPSDTISIREGLEGIEIAMCERFRVETLVFDYRPAGGDWISSEWHDLAQLMQPGDILNLPASDSLPEPEDLVGESDIYVLVNDGTSVADARLVIPQAGLDDRWLQPSGALTNSPCVETRDD